MPQQLYFNGRYIGSGTTSINAVAHDLTHALYVRRLLSGM